MYYHLIDISVDFVSKDRQKYIDCLLNKDYHIHRYEKYKTQSLDIAGEFCNLNVIDAVPDQHIFRTLCMEHVDNLIFIKNDDKEITCTIDFNIAGAGRFQLNSYLVNAVKVYADEKLYFILKLHGFVE